MFLSPGEALHRLHRAVVPESPAPRPHVAEDIQNDTGQDQAGPDDLVDHVIVRVHGVKNQLNGSDGNHSEGLGNALL